MSEHGIIIAEDGFDVKRSPNKVDSRRPRWSVDLEAKPPHMDIVTFDTFTAFTDPGGGDANHTQKEVLFTLEHKLGFTPLALAYFYVESYNGVSDSGLAGAYGGEVYFMSGSSGTVNDGITYSVDKEFFKIVHRFDTFGFNTGYTSNAPFYKIRVKYYIMPINTELDFYSPMGREY